MHNINERFNRDAYLRMHLAYQLLRNQEGNQSVCINTCRYQNIPEIPSLHLTKIITLSFAASSYIFAMNRFRVCLKKKNQPNLLEFVGCLMICTHVIIT